MLKQSIQWVLCLAFLQFSASLAVAEDREPVIIVSGEGSSAMAPDMAVISLSVATDKPTAGEALAENSAAMAQVITALKDAGIESRDLQTSGLSIQPRYSYPRNNNQGESRKLQGYSVRNSLTIRVRELDKVGVIIDQSVALGVNQGGNIVFGNDDPSQALAQARQRAVEDASAKARTLAAAAEVKLGPVIEIAERSTSRAPRPESLRSAGMVMDASSVPVEAGENNYRVNVEMTFSLQN